MPMSIKILLPFLFLLQIQTPAPAPVSSPRQEILLEKGWKFTRADNAGAAQPVFADATWQSVTVPHDWAIYGPFDENADMQKVAITQDGETAPTLKSGRTGGLPFVGVGWYRLRFDAPGFGPDKRASLLFDGAMSQARVWLNGKEIGYWPYGYNSFHFDISAALRPTDNLLAVRLENLPESSRWYPGAGLYRNVRLIITDAVHIPVWGTQLTTPVVDRQYARVNLRTRIELPASLINPANKAKIELVTEIKDAARRRVSSARSQLGSSYDPFFEQNFIVVSPRLWTPDTPALYTAESTLYVDGEARDRYSTRFGIRRLEIIPNHGMFLNGAPIKFRGVCNHHDLGPLGAAVNVAALRRQLVMLKDLGVNAIRTTHNMPAPELVRLCDEMGFMVIVEPFDEWNIPKVRNGYHLYFKEWAEKDMVNMLHNYRNNPAVVMWSIGNEVPGQGSPEGLRTAKFLQDICHREDPTRLVSIGMDQADAALKSHLAAIIDVPGFNYRLQFYDKAYKELPQEIVLGSETASTVSSRGIYHFPVERTSDQRTPDHQTSSYDLSHCGWSNLPEDDWVRQDDYAWTIGEFVWTGFDYLGEPTPYYNDWPNHSSMFGIIDLAGIPKDRYYLYRSHWRPETETLHILPHWTWPGREGKTTPVFVYTNHPTAELFVNGVSQGRVSKDESITLTNTDTPAAARQLRRQRRYRLMWMDVKYQPGTLKVVAYDKAGRAVAEREVHTAGPAHHLELAADRTELTADGKDLAYITVKVVDKDGNLCPQANNQITFTVSGAGSYRAAASGDATSLEPFQQPRMRAFGGQLAAIVQSGEKAGAITFAATAPGLTGATLSLKSIGK